MTLETLNALGLVEVRGLPAAIETADAMLKSARVRLLRQIGRDPAQITLIVEGELGACRAAVDAGLTLAERLGACVAGHVIGRPDGDTEAFVLVLAELGRQPFGHEPKPAVKQTVAVLESARVLAELTALPLGCGVATLAKRLGVAEETVQGTLSRLLVEKRVLLSKGRYRAVRPRKK